MIDFSSIYSRTPLPFLRSAPTAFLQIDSSWITDPTVRHAASLIRAYELSRTRVVQGTLPSCVAREVPYLVQNEWHLSNNV